MPKMPFTANCATRWIVIALALQLPGCMAQSRHKTDIDRTPIMNTGSRASIIYPGQGPILMPGSVLPGSNNQVRSNNQGASSQTGRPSSAGSGGGEMVFLGGARQDITKHLKVTEDPLVVKYLTAPIALLAAPIVMAHNAYMGEKQPGPAIPRPVEPLVQQAPRASVQEGSPRRSGDYEATRSHYPKQEPAPQQASNQRAALTTPKAAVSYSQPGSAPRSGALSIQEELQALRNHPEAPPRTQPIDERAVAPPRPAPRVSAAPQPTYSALTSASATTETTAANRYPTAHGIVDRNDDGEIDHWIFREKGEIVRQIYDEDYDGRPDRTILFDPKTHQPSHVEEDTRGDGALDSWVDYHQGVIQRRRADIDGDGMVDTWSFYRQGELIRHEQDTTGDGFRDTITSFDGSRKIREQRDTNGDGQLNATLHFDSDGKVTRQEDDRNGDGNTDTISHYRNGRLTKRELLDAPEFAEGLSSDDPTKATR